MQHFFWFFTTKTSCKTSQSNTGNSVRIVICIFFSVATEYLMHGQTPPPPYSFHKKQRSQNLWCWITDRIKMPWLWISSNALHNNYSPVCTEVQIIALEHSCAAKSAAKDKQRWNSLLMSLQSKDFRLTRKEKNRQKFHIRKWMLRIYHFVSSERL